jgi:hypothetical protein
LSGERQFNSIGGNDRTAQCGTICAGRSHKGSNGMRSIKTFVILSGAAVLVACATPAPAPATATGHAVAPATALAAGQQQHPASFPGYTRVVDNGKEMFCRYETPTGSQIRQQTCVTRAQLEAEQNDAQQSLQNALQRSTACTAGYGGTLAGGTCQP